ncbi:uncharacterized protein LOC131882063 [Tigriopus californicus]|uniref:uncharacterized protein LOC131882063 n=1 Tax=Tigriopus californicus TaxID=6832 RepID=UPI0027DA528B|nr:uncharacterized protein LOC131882063 [Tigriopus californicus]
MDSGAIFVPSRNVSCADGRVVHLDMEDTCESFKIFTDGCSYCYNQNCTYVVKRNVACWIIACHSADPGGKFDLWLAAGGLFCPIAALVVLVLICAIWRFVRRGRTVVTSRKSPSGEGAVSSISDLADPYFSLGREEGLPPFGLATPSPSPPASPAPTLEEEEEERLVSIAIAHLKAEREQEDEMDQNKRPVYNDDGETFDEIDLTRYLRLFIPNGNVFKSPSLFSNTIRRETYGVKLNAIFFITGDTPMPFLNRN